MGEEGAGQLEQPERRTGSAFADGTGVLDRPLDREREAALAVEAALEGKTQHEVRVALRISADRQRAGQSHLAGAREGLRPGRCLLEQRLRGRHVREKKRGEELHCFTT